MATIGERLKKLVTGTNFWRAVIIYGSSLGIGLFGFFVIGGTAGDYMLTCFPGFGTGIAVALLNNGHKQPVTLKSSASTFAMLLVFTAGSYILGIEILAVFVGFGFSIVGSFVGLKFCSWENRKQSKEDVQQIKPKEKDAK